MLGYGFASGGALAAQRYVIVDAKDTVLQEHQDRLVRLQRVAAAHGIDPVPEFHEDVVPADRAPDSFHTDIPVLRVVFTEKSFFNTASSNLRPEADAILLAIAEVLQNDPADTAVFVAGHTDSRGSEAYNYNLSVSRAETVAQELHGDGVGEVALWRVGFGKAVPLYPNDSDAHMAFNRRVEFLFAARTEAVLYTLQNQLGHVCVSSNRETSDKCKRNIELRSHFDAVQLTSRQVNLDLSPVALARPSGSRPMQVVNGSRTRDTVVGAGPLHVAQLSSRRLNISLDSRQLTISTPNR